MTVGVQEKVLNCRNHTFHLHKVFIENFSNVNYQVEWQRELKQPHVYQYKPSWRYIQWKLRGNTNSGNTGTQNSLLLTCSNQYGSGFYLQLHPECLLIL